MATYVPIDRALLTALLGPFPEDIVERHMDYLIEVAASVWGNGDISPALRSAVTLGVLTALGTQHELAAHVGRAVNVSGLSRHEVNELLHHTSVYAGLPRANDALRTAKQVFDKLDETASSPT
jgi:alkylhydroperoxidase/carboxymuconolactone decarboxylase family protein YurZ